MEYKEALALALEAVRRTESTPEGQSIDPCAELEKEGFKTEYSYRTTPAQNMVWEHPDATAYNATLNKNSASVLNFVYCTLYGFPDSLPNAPFTLVVGRVGNTVSYDLWPPA